MAGEVTRFVHGQESLSVTIETTKRLFDDPTAPAESLTIDDLEGMEGVVKSNYDKTKLNSGIDVVSFLAETNIFPSKGEARKTIQGGGISVNRKKIDNVQLKIDTSFLLHNKYVLVQKGKKNYYLVKMV